MCPTIRDIEAAVRLDRLRRFNANYKNERRCDEKKAEKLRHRLRGNSPGISTSFGIVGFLGGLPRDRVGEAGISRRYCCLRDSSILGCPTIKRPDTEPRWGYQRIVQLGERIMGSAWIRYYDEDELNEFGHWVEEARGPALGANAR
jgi:hypothetical protein